MNQLFEAAACRGWITHARPFCIRVLRWLAQIGVCGAMLGGAATAQARETAAVFDGPPTDYAELIAGSADEPSSILRIINVEERAGVPRRGELVRVPVFFAPGECANLEELAIVAAAGDVETPLPWQADDIRRAPDGGVGGVHLWFATDLQAGERRRYHLVRRNAGTRSGPKSGMSAGAAREIVFRNDAGAVVFGPGGELRSISVGAARWSFGPAGATPRVKIAVPASGEQPAREIVFGRDGERTVEWSDGPLFAKVRVRREGADGARLEQEFRIPRHGREVVVTTAVYPGTHDGAVVREQRLLEGELDGGANAVEVRHVPAGVRRSLRAEHAYTVTALSRPAQQRALLAVPLVIGGANGHWKRDEGGSVVLQGLRNLQRGKEGEKGSLYAFWTEVRLVPVEGAATPESLWEKYRERVQPLVAVVEEPAAGIDHLHAALRDTVREMKPIGWRQEAARALVLGDAARAGKILQQKPSAKEADADALWRGAENAQAKLTNQGQRRLREDEKGRAYGGIDPYHITYTQSAAAALAALLDAPPRVKEINLAMARAVRRAGGKVDAAGYPYIDCFSRTLNMQMGPVLFGLTAGVDAGDLELAGFYRDLAKAPPVRAVFGRGQRPYTGAPAKTPDQTDFLYQSICDFWLRTTELLGDEDLQLHPLAYSRFTDCVDVMADNYHGVAARHKAELPGRARANFFRGQAHTHRWLGWSCAPYIRLLERPAERGTIGLTEAIHHTRALKGRWKNWPDLTFYVLADLLVREGLERYRAPELLPPAGSVRVRRSGGSAEIVWDPVPGAQAYRIYSAETPGGPYRWLNSPHAETPGPVVREPRFVDETPRAGAVYVVTAVDESGREGRWPE